jgi:hypothetical protein
MRIHVPSQAGDNATMRLAQQGGDKYPDKVLIFW